MHAEVGYLCLICIVYVHKRLALARNSRQNGKGSAKADTSQCRFLHQDCSNDDNIITTPCTSLPSAGLLAVQRCFSLHQGCLVTGII